MKISLILPPNPPHFEIFNRKLSGFYFEKGNVTPPLGLGYLAAVLEKNGHKVEIIDMNAENLGLHDVMERIRIFKPGVVGISTLTHIFPYARAISIAVKRRFPDIFTVLGGRHIEIYPEHILTFGSIDFGIIGDGEFPLRDLVSLLESYGYPSDDFFKKAPKIAGLIYRDKDGSHRIIPEKPPGNLDVYPFPARHLFKRDLYYTFFSDSKRPNTSMIGSRGCPFRCNYCAEKFASYRFRSPKNVMDEIIEVYNKFGIRDIYFNDSTFTVNRKWVIELCKMLISEKLDLRFYIRTRVDCVDREMLKMLAAAGCARINYGIESGDRRILKRLGKHTDPEMARRAVRLTKEAGIPVWGFFMIGNPGETVESIRRTIKFAIDLDLDFVQFSRLNPFPGTELYFDYLKKGGRDVWLDYIYGRSSDRNVLMQDSNFTIKELDKWLIKAYRMYYFRPTYIFKKLREISGIKELIRYIGAALAII